MGERDDDFEIHFGDSDSEENSFHSQADSYEEVYLFIQMELCPGMSLNKKFLKPNKIVEKKFGFYIFS